MARLEGKVAIVTGAASGIGKASVELFRSEGATVVGADAAEGADVVADAGSEEGVRRLVEDVVAKHGGLDIFFANAGISGGFANIAEQTAADWAEILRVNLIGPFLAIKHAAPIMAEAGGGSIICTASVAGLRSGAGIDTATTRLEFKPPSGISGSSGPRSSNSAESKSPRARTVQIWVNPRINVWHRWACVDFNTLTVRSGSVQLGAVCQSKVESRV